MTVILILGGVVLFVAVLGGALGIALSLARSRGRRVHHELTARHGSRALLTEPMARSFGMESEGMAQVRGNGCLVLTPDALDFEMWAPRRSIHIPRSTIQTVETARSHLGKVGAMLPLLRVRFVDPTGQPDAIAWQVRDIDRWLAALGGAR